MTEHFKTFKSHLDTVLDKQLKVLLLQEGGWQANIQVPSSLNYSLILYLADTKAETELQKSTVMNTKKKSLILQLRFPW